MDKNGCVSATGFLGRMIQQLLNISEEIICGCLWFFWMMSVVLMVNSVIRARLVLIYCQWTTLEIFIFSKSSQLFALKDLPLLLGYFSIMFRWISLQNTLPFKRSGSVKMFNVFKKYFIAHQGLCKIQVK